MPAQLSPAVQELIRQPNFANIATLMPDGSPQVSPVWIDTDGRNIIFNTAEGRQKPRNLRRDGRVALTVLDQSNPYRYAEIRGRVVDLTPEGGDAHIDAMAKKYLGQDTYPFRQPGEQRVTFRLRPERVQHHGG